MDWADKNPVWFGGGDNQVPQVSIGTLCIPWLRVQQCHAQLCMCTETVVCKGNANFLKECHFQHV